MAPGADILVPVATPDHDDGERLKDGRGRFTRSPAAARKRDRAVQLRAKGWTFAAVAREVGYKHAAAAQKAVTTALAQIPQQSCEQLIRQEEARLEEMDSKLAEIISSPPIQHSAIGKPVIDPRSGEPVSNMSVVIQAMKERRMVGESLRKMRGADKPAPAPALNPVQLEQVAKIAAIEQHRAQFARRAPLVLPADYGSLPPEQQARAHLAALRAAKEQQDRAIAQHQADDDIPEAEIVDE